MLGLVTLGAFSAILLLLTISTKVVAPIYMSRKWMHERKQDEEYKDDYSG